MLIDIWLKYSEVIKFDLQIMTQTNLLVLEQFRTSALKIHFTEGKILSLFPDNHPTLQSKETMKYELINICSHYGWYDLIFDILLHVGTKPHLRSSVLRIALAL